MTPMPDQSSHRSALKSTDCRGYPKTEQLDFDGLSNVKIVPLFEGPRELKFAARRVLGYVLRVYSLRQNRGVNKTKMVKSSSRPKSIRRHIRILLCGENQA